MAERVYCTYFDHNYLTRGLALYRSLQRHAPGSRLWVLCLSESCYQALRALKLANQIPRRLDDFETANPAVEATRASRSMIEYYFTCSPAWMLSVLNSEPGAEWVTYLDSDLFFFASPEPIYDEMRDASFGIIPHRFSSRLADMRRFGVYNVGWVSVRRCDQGIEALRWWRERCIEWCYDRVEGKRFADQRYLDRLPQLFGGIHVISHLGANLAPWNLANYQLELRDGSIIIEERFPLVFFHFYGVKRTGRYYFNSHRVFHAPFPKLVREHIYKPYVLALRQAELTVAFHLGDLQIETIRRPTVASGLPNGLRRVRTLGIRGLDVLTGRAIAIPDASA